MMGMEKMLASMIGLTPEQMQQMAQLFQSTLETSAQALIDIRDKLDDVVARLERLENGNADNCSRGTGKQLADLRDGSGDS